MPRAKTCGPPKTVRVKGHWRVVRAKRKKKRSSSAGGPKGPYWISTDGQRSCGHHHRTMSGAIACRRRRERAFRAYRARHGRKNIPAKVFTVDRKS